MHRHPALSPSSADMPLSPAVRASFTFQGSVPDAGPAFIDATFDLSVLEDWSLVGAGSSPLARSIALRRGCASIDLFTSAPGHPVYTCYFHLLASLDGEVIALECAARIGIGGRLLGRWNEVGQLGRHAGALDREFQWELRAVEEEEEEKEDNGKGNAMPRTDRIQRSFTVTSKPMQGLMMTTTPRQQQEEDAPIEPLTPGFRVFAGRSVTKLGNNATETTLRIQLHADGSLEGESEENSVVFNAVRGTWTAFQVEYTVKCRARAYEFHGEWNGRALSGAWRIAGARHALRRQSGWFSFAVDAKPTARSIRG